MNCKLLLGALLLGVFFFSSCVDDSESQSVTEIRLARAEKIKAEASLAASQAKAEEIRAAAEAALLQAQAELAKAEVKLKEAEAAQIAAQSESDKKRAEIDYLLAQEDLRTAKANADRIIKQAEYELENMKIESQIRLLELQRQLEMLKNDDPVLSKAIQDYNIFIVQVNDYKMKIAGKELDLSKQKALLDDAKSGIEDNAARQINLYENYISNLTNAIATSKKEIENYTLLLQKKGDNLEEEIAHLEKQKADLIYNKSFDLQKTLREKDDAKEAAFQVVMNFRSLNTVKYYSGIWSDEGLEDVIYYTVPELNIQILERKEYIDMEKLEIRKLEEKYGKAELELESLYTVLQSATKAEADAYEIYNKTSADPESTAEQIEDSRDAWVKASEKKSAADDDYWEAKTIVDDYPSQILYRKNNLKYREIYLADLVKSVNLYSNDSEYPKKLENDYVVAFRAYETALNEYNDVSIKITAFDNTISELKTIYYGNNSSWNVDALKSTINSLEEIIADYESDIKNYNREINKLKEENKVDIALLNLDIQKLENEIESLKIQLNAVQKQVDMAKAIIDEKTK